MLQEAATCEAVLGLDVGKFSHWACLVTRHGEILSDRQVMNAETDLDLLFSQVEPGTPPFASSNASASSNTNNASKYTNSTTISSGTRLS